MAKRVSDNIKDKDTTDLKLTSIKVTFDTLPLDKRRKLVTELFSSARMSAVCTFPIPTDNDRFGKWLCSGEKKSFTKEEADNLLLVWGFVKRYAYSSCIDFVDPEEK